MFTYCPPAVRSSDLITILTSCLRSFPAVKAFSGKLKVRLQSQENQIEIALMYPKGFVTLNIPIHIQCIAMTRKRSEWLQIRKAFWQDLGLSRGFRAPSLENAPTPTVYTGYRFVSKPWT